MYFPLSSQKSLFKSFGETLGPLSPLVSALVRAELLNSRGHKSRCILGERRPLRVRLPEPEAGMEPPLGARDLPLITASAPAWAAESAWLWRCVSPEHWKLWEVFTTFLPIPGTTALSRRETPAAACRRRDHRSPWVPCEGWDERSCLGDTRVT